MKTHNLEWSRNDPEVEDLYCRPQHKIRFQSGQEHFLKLARHCAATTTFSHSHECEEAGQAYPNCQYLRKTRSCSKWVGSLTDGSKDQLIQGHSLQRRDSLAVLSERKRPSEEGEPLILQRRHYEPVGHESRNSFKVEPRRRRRPKRYHIFICIRRLLVCVIRV